MSPDLLSSEFVQWKLLYDTLLFTMNKPDFTILRGNLLATLHSLPLKNVRCERKHMAKSHPVVQAKAIANVVSPIVDEESDAEEGTSSEEENPDIKSQRQPH